MFISISENHGDFFFSFLGTSGTFFSDSDPRDFIFREGDPLGGEKFFKCNICEYKAKQQSNAIRHVKYMHLNYSENLFCQLCQKSYSRKANYMEHVRTVHRGNSSLMEAM